MGTIINHNKILEKAAEQDVCEVVNCCSATGIPNDHIPSWVQDAMVNEFIHGAKWQRENLWKPADGDDLPEIGREVIVLIKYNAQRNIHDEEYPTYRVGFGHRPDPKGWEGKSVTTGKVEHYTPKTYDKGGWNIPNVKYWLDVELPKEKNYEYPKEIPRVCNLYSRQKERIYYTSRKRESKEKES